MSFIRIKKIKGYEYKYEVENFRVGGKVRQRIIRYLGSVDKPAVPTAKRAFSAVVQKNGMVWISVSRRLAGERIEGSYRLQPSA